MNKRQIKVIKKAEVEKRQSVNVVQEKAPKVSIVKTVKSWVSEYQANCEAGRNAALQFWQSN